MEDLRYQIFADECNIAECSKLSEARFLADSATLNCGVAEVYDIAIGSVVYTAYGSEVE